MPLAFFVRAAREFLVVKRDFSDDRYALPKRTVLSILHNVDIMMSTLYLGTTVIVDECISPQVDTTMVHAVESK